jgi:chloramphenicol 3-O-phosphotransferase
MSKISLTVGLIFAPVGIFLMVTMWIFPLRFMAVMPDIVRIFFGIVFGLVGIGCLVASPFQRRSEKRGDRC